MNKYFYLCLALFCHLACTSSETKVSEDQKNVVITTGGYVLTTQAIADIDQAYLLVGRGRSAGSSAADAFIKCIPIDRADALRKQYGDFTRSRNSGTEEAQNSAMDLQLIIPDSACRKALKEAQDSRENRASPVIRITGRVLQIGQAIYRGTPMHMGGAPGNIVLADRITLEQASYSF